MADLTLGTSLQQCGGNEYSNTLYTAVYMNIVSQNANTGVTTIHIQIAGWAANGAGGGTTRTWSGNFRMYKGTSGDVSLVDGSFSGTYSNFTSPVWVINQNYTIQHTRSGGTWQAIQSFGVNVAWYTQLNDIVTHGHRWTTQGYNNVVIPAFNVTKYNVTYNGNGATGGTVPSTQTKYYGVALTLATNNLTRSNSAATANGYKVTFHANGGSSTPAAITQTTYTTYTKNGWNTNTAGTGTHYNNAASYTGNAALTLYAQWTTGTGRNAITLPAAISRTGYTFGGWNTKADGTGSNYSAGASYTPSAAITLYAKWNIINGTFYYHRGTAYDNQSGQLYGTAKSGYTLVTALSQTGMAGNSSGTVITGTWNINDTAHDVYNTTTLFNNPTGASHAAEASQWKVWNATRGKWLNTTGMSAASLNFASLVGNNSTTYGDTLVLFANWQRNSYTITTAVSPSGGGTVTGSGTYAYEASYTLTATAASGYRFDNWTFTGGRTGSVTTTTATGTMPASNITATANFTPLYYLDLNGWLDNALATSISPMGTADITVGGTLRSNDATDYYVAWPPNTTYSISDIKANPGYIYTGVHSGSTSGTITNAKVSVSLSFMTMTAWIYHGGAWHRAIPWVYHNGTWHRAWTKLYQGSTWHSTKTN